MDMFATNDGDSRLSSKRGDGPLCPRAGLRIASLFAGIGGFDRAFEAADAEIIVHCEIDPFCRAVLKRHWPDAKLLDDIRSVAPDELPTTDVWTAGFPCQDVSLARGNHGRSGLSGNHTSLFFELISLIEAKHPKVILLENVVGLLNSHKGCDFAIILRELTKLGYAVSWRVLNARYFGIPQSRSRVFMVAWRANYRQALASLFENVPGRQVGGERAGFMAPYAHGPTKAVVPEIAYCVAATSGRHTGNDWSRSYISYHDRVRRPTPAESERLQGFPAGWTIPGEEYRVPARGLDSERYRAIGNAVAVPVVRWVAERIVNVFDQYNPPCSRKDFKIEALQLFPDLRRQTTALQFEGILEAVDAGEFAHRWKGCGIAWGNDILEGANAPAPSTVVKSRFVDILDAEIPDDRYFLTPNAAAGMLRRADSVGRTFFPPMRAALENMVRGLPLAVSQPLHLTGEQSAKTSICPSRAVQRRDLERVGAGAARTLRASH